MLCIGSTYSAQKTGLDAFLEYKTIELFNRCIYLELASKPSFQNKHGNRIGILPLYSDIIYICLKIYDTSCTRSLFKIQDTFFFARNAGRRMKWQKRKMIFIFLGRIIERKNEIFRVFFNSHSLYCGSSPSVCLGRLSE